MAFSVAMISRVGTKRPPSIGSIQRLRRLATSAEPSVISKRGHGLDSPDLPAAPEAALQEAKDTEKQLDDINREIQSLRELIQGPGQSMAHMKYQLSAIRKDIAAIRPSPWQQKPFCLVPSRNSKSGEPRWDQVTQSIQIVSPVTNDHVSVPNIWLRDHCQCSSCVHEDTRQRQVDSFNIPSHVRITACVEDPTGFQVTWDDGHQSKYNAEWLAKSALRHKSWRRQGIPQNVFRWSSKIIEDPPEVPYGRIMASDDGVRDWLDLLRQYGFCYVDGCPPTPEATQKLLERISFIRNTHYGGFWDFTSDLASKDTAYTSIELPAHTDTTYFSDPAGLQLFHLLSHTDGKGGASTLVDGFYAAARLFKENPEAYNILSKVNVYSHASGNEGISIQPYRSFPVLIHDPEDHHLVQIRWNSSDRAAIDMPLEDVQQWYDAARVWESIIRSPEAIYNEQLRPGRPLIFDNWRVLHGRTVFTGKRRMCGGYINRDDYISRFKMLHYGSGAVLKSIGTA